MVRISLTFNTLIQLCLFALKTRVTSIDSGLCLHSSSSLLPTRFAALQSQKKHPPSVSSKKCTRVAMSNSDKKEACVPSPFLTENEVLAATRSLLESIVAQDWETYTSLVDASISCFEPEAFGNLVEGLEFHKFYFNNENKNNDRTSNYSSKRKRVNNTTMVRPHVRILAGGNAAVVSYVRLTQQQVEIGGASNIDNSGPQQQQQQVTTETRACEETRVWERNATTGMLLNVHLHRSTIG